ncbi:MAG: 30S ribosomal protein S24e [Candidatus Micrarchaeia archaeon]
MTNFDLQIESEKLNPLLRRREISFSISFDAATPSRKDILALLCSKMNLDPKLVVIDKLDQEYGMKKLKGYAKAYADEKSMKLEKRYKIARTLGKEKPEKNEEKKPERE